MYDLVLIAHNLRSAHNVGSLLRTAEGLGVTEVYLTGYTPFPSAENDDRLPHIAKKVSAQINKTALGAENTLDWKQRDDIEPLIKELHEAGYTIAALEQTATALHLPTYQPPQKLTIIVGREVEGVEVEVLELTDLQLDIPMHGQKESFNVVQAAAMALYHCRYP
jgi:23S rRNA (guanosine2251-2'-O)-methyltransferase